MKLSLTHRGSAVGIARMAALAVVIVAWVAMAAPAHASFGLAQFDAGFGDGPLATPFTQAGGHGDMYVDLAFNRAIDPAAGTGLEMPDEQPRDIKVDLPAGLYGNPTEMQTCTEAQLLAGEGYCNPDAQVGYVDVQLTHDGGGFLGHWLAPVYNMVAPEGEPALLEFAANHALVKVDISVRTDGDYGLTATLRNIEQTVPIYGASMHLWGVPADPSHNDQRITTFFGPPTASGAGPRPFLTLPARCEPVTITARAHSWQHPDRWVTESDTTPALTGCDALKFNPTVKARPVDAKADTPSGYDVDVSVPQDDTYSGVATPQLKKAVVTLPAGVAISPASADGLQACTDDQMGPHTAAQPACPDASKIGTVTIDTPLLKNPLEGDIILGSPEPGRLFRLWIVAQGSGVLVKLPGVAQPDPATGQLTTTFQDTPQLPFSNLHLHFKGGPRAPLANPQTCGTKTTTAEFTPWAGPMATPTDSFDVTGCTGGFAPSFEAGTTSPEAGAFSPFTMTIRRNDGEQEISKIAVNLPPGLLGVLAGIPQCPDAQAAAGTCADATQLGTTTVESGSGAQPLPLTGKVFLAGAYKGQPYSLAIVVRAVAGPFDLGTVVVRAPLNIDASGGKVSVPADALPTILDGVPLRLRTINVTLDRPGFMFNPTNCNTMAVGATLTSVGGAVATPASRFQALGCGELPLKPRFGIRLTGGRRQLGKNGHPGVVADLSQTPGQSGLSRVSVPLPTGVSVDIKNLGGICKAADAAARSCPTSAVIGQASVKTPALPGTLTGPVYLVENKTVDPKTGKTSAGLPRLWLKLQGSGVPLDLFADNTITGSRLIPTFSNIPDAPISSFHLEIVGGAKGILLTSKDQCAAARTSPTVFEGQNGKVVRRTVKFGSDCTPRIAKTKTTHSSVRVTVSGIGAGRLSVSGSGVHAASASIRSASAATVTAKLTAAAKRTLAHTGRVRVRLAVVYTPTTGKATRLHKTVTIR